MKKIILMTAILAAGCFAQAHGETTRLCPKYSCTAQSDGSVDYQRPHVGFGKGDTLASAQADAVRSCSDLAVGSSCVVTQCDKFKGPVLPIIPCKSQW